MVIKSSLFKTISFLLLGISLLLSTSCGSKDEKEKETKAKGKKTCFYTYNHSSSTLEWTAFKFTNKTGVTGTFNTFQIQGLKGSDDPKALLSSLTFKIPTKSVETQNEERNEKIANIFFKSLHTDTIVGSVQDLNLKNGTATLSILMNGIQKTVKGKCSLREDRFTFKASIDVKDWKGLQAIETLNKVCKDLHTGTDGKSILWSIIDLSFSTQLLSDCQ